MRIKKLEIGDKPITQEEFQLILLKKINIIINEMNRRSRSKDEIKE